MPLLALVARPEVPSLFVTNALSEVKILPFIQIQGEKVWNSVSLRFHRPALLVKHGAADPDADVCSGILLLSHPRQLADLARDPTIGIFQASLIHQRIVHDEGHWRMIDLHSVWEGVEGTGEFAQNAYVYVFEDGQRHLCKPPLIRSTLD